jgi:drug/metabolite transporter (DMT)-like permease
MALVIQLTDPRGLVRTLSESGWPVVVSALLIVGSASSFVLSIKHTSVANTVFIMSARPVLTALAAWFFLREKTVKSLWFAIAGVMCGIFIVVSGSLTGGSFLKDGFAVIAVICLALNGTLWRRYKEMSRFAVVGLGGFFIALAMFIPASPSQFSLRTWLIMAAMGLISAPLGRVLNALSSRYIPAAEMATLTLINAVLAPIWAFLLFNEQPPAATLIGGAVIFGSIAFYILMTGTAFARQLKASA